ncbi:hypothetical protein M569_12471 [Genlisea aurea]|uniref:TF-B3 domain-containing protein n=1 Tax=Genlisea aurea TaxID=192259 RepID=S8C6C8_9LAMI|nr:hypothetical protein M569_12471 [Genlisea aurea]
MKLKIVHQNQETRPGEDHGIREFEPEMKKTEEEQILFSSGDDHVEQQIFEPLEPTPVSNPDSVLLSGKRKRKPKWVIDEFVPAFRRKKKKKKSSSSNRKHGARDAAGLWTSSSRFKSPTVMRAEEVQSSLGDDQPSFLKPLVRSHVGSCFWMGLPVPFCRIHLPGKDAEMILENENGEEFPIKYIAHKTGLSAGWRKFAAGNKLLEGDVLIFQLIGPCRLKVYIIRANDLPEVDGALSLLNLESRIKRNDPDATLDSCNEKKRHVSKQSPLLDVLTLEQQPENDSDEVASEVLESTKTSETCYSFEDVKSFEGFHIMVNGVCIDSDIPEQTRRNYYDLCCTRNQFLHDHLLPGLYRKLASSMIVETLNIADSIRACKLVDTPREDFEVWEKSLRSFELLGLDVGFLRARLQELSSLAFESEGASNVREYREARDGKLRAEDEIRKLESRLGELKEARERYDGLSERRKAEAERFESTFREAVDAPW